MCTSVSLLLTYTIIRAPGSQVNQSITTKMLPLVVEGAALKLQMLWPGYDRAMLVSDGFLCSPVIRFHTHSLGSDLESHCDLGGSHMLGRMHVPQLIVLDGVLGHRAWSGRCPRSSCEPCWGRCA